MKIVKTNPIIIFFSFINLVFLPLLLTPWGLMFAEECMSVSLSLSLFWIRGHGGLKHTGHVRMSSKMPFTFRVDDQTIFIVTAVWDTVSFTSNATTWRGCHNLAVHCNCLADLRVLTRLHESESLALTQRRKQRTEMNVSRSGSANGCICTDGTSQLSG